MQHDETGWSFPQARRIALLAFLFGLGWCGSLFVNGIWTDIQEHAFDSLSIVRGDLKLPNFLYFLLVWLLAAGQSNVYLLLGASALLLGAALGAKYLITRKLLSEWGLETQAALLLAWTLLFVANLPGPSFYYLGQINPNIWHNSTLIFVMPFALLLFRSGLRYVENPSMRGAAAIAGWILLNLWIKPSFFFCFGAVFPLMLLLRWKLGRAFWMGLLPLILGLCVLWLQTAILFPGDGRGEGIALKPLYVWSAGTSNIALSVLASYAFPLAYVLCYPGRLRERSLLFSWLMVIWGLMIFALLTETGSRALHGNFAWQNITCSYLLFMCTAADAWRHACGWRRQALTALFTLHLLSGIVYLYRIILTGAYF